MGTAIGILCILLLSIYLVLSVFWAVLMVIDFVDDRKSKKRDAKWEAERHQFEKERAIRDAEYHTARMKQYESK